MRWYNGDDFADHTSDKTGYQRRIEWVRQRRLGHFMPRHGARVVNFSAADRLGDFAVWVGEHILEK